MTPRRPDNHRETLSDYAARPMNRQGKNSMSDPRMTSLIFSFTAGFLIGFPFGIWCCGQHDLAEHEKTMEEGEFADTGPAGDPDEHGW